MRAPHAAASAVALRGPCRIVVVVRFEVAERIQRLVFGDFLDGVSFKLVD